MVTAPPPRGCRADGRAAVVQECGCRAPATEHRPFHGRRPPGGTPGAGQEQARAPRYADPGRRAAVPGTPRNVAARSRVTTPSTSRRRRADGEQGSGARRRRSDELDRRLADVVVRRRQGDGEALAGPQSARRGPIEDELDRRVDHRRQGQIGHRPVQTRWTLTMGDWPSAALGGEHAIGNEPLRDLGRCCDHDGVRDVVPLVRRHLRPPSPLGETA